MTPRPLEIAQVIRDGGGTAPVELTVADKLRARGHHVTLYGPPDARRHAEAVGFKLNALEWPKPDPGPGGGPGRPLVARMAGAAAAWARELMPRYSAQGSGINAEAKLLLFTYAFETLGVVRADLKTDARNHRSRGAMEALGIPFEGVLRNWSVSWAPGEEGALRDSAMFAVTDSDWPGVRAIIADRLSGISRSRS